MEGGDPVSKLTYIGYAGQWPRNGCFIIHKKNEF